MSTGWKLDPRAYVQSQLEEMARDGGIARRAERDGIDYGDAMVELAEELYRPYKEIEEKYATKRTASVDEGELDRRARSYAERHGVPYAVALDAVMPGGSTVELSEGAPEKPRVDAGDAALNRQAEDYARRKGCSYTVALEAILEGR